MESKSHLKTDIQILYESPEVLMARGRELRSQMIFAWVNQGFLYIKKIFSDCIKNRTVIEKSICSDADRDVQHNH